MEDKISHIADIEEIKKLQKAYGYYLERGIFDELTDMLSGDTESVETGGTGVYPGKDGAIKHFSPGSSSPGRPYPYSR